jgi:hypothetical protein
MPAGAPTPKVEAKSAEANAIVPIGRGICADIFPSSRSSGDHLHVKFDYKAMQIGQSRVGFGSFCWPFVWPPVEKNQTVLLLATA